uniref:Phytocyanin domain-containing protein n=1 Tax=Kalanchoe fedtschenkoi TaxID=63787 RepID=A0A7N0ZV79_KALFE
MASFSVAAAASSSCLILVTMLSALLTLSSASHFRVGGPDGVWTSSNNVNYTKWVDSIHFQVEDVLRFVYDNKKENVIQVSQQEYKSCKVTAPVKKWSSGDDSVSLDTAGYFYFISSVDGHCQGRARFDVKVYANDKEAGHDQAPSTPPAGAPVVPAPGPKPSAAGVSVKASSVGWFTILPLLILLN